MTGSPAAAPPVPPPSAARPAADPLLERVALLNLALQVLIVVTGGLVRLTGSGLGCPTWPHCVPGSFTPVVDQAEGYHKHIEFGNRLLTFVLGVVALATLALVIRRVRRAGRDGTLLVLGAAPLVGVLAQALLGGVTVLTGLAPGVVAAHFLLSMVLVSVSTLLLLRLRPLTWNVAPPAEAVRIAAALSAAVAAVLVLGTVVTGSGPHAGDADEPVRFGLDPRTVSWLHADAAIAVAGLALALLLVLRLRPAPWRARRRAEWLLLAVLAQGVVGYVQYFTDLPEVLVLLHMLGASVLTVAATAAVAGVAEGWRANRVRTGGTGPARPPRRAGSGT